MKAKFRTRNADLKEGRRKRFRKVDEDANELFKCNYCGSVGEDRSDMVGECRCRVSTREACTEYMNELDGIEACDIEALDPGIPNRRR